MAAIVTVAEFGKQIEEGLAQAERVDLGVAFATRSGLKFGEVEQNLSRMNDAGRPIRILVDLRLGNTDPEFLDTLLRWKEKNSALECKAYFAEGGGVFHPKLYVFYLHSGRIRVLTGSANLTGPAYSSNVEHGVMVEGSRPDPLIDGCISFFEDLWSSHHAFHITPQALSLYRSQYRRKTAIERKTSRKMTGTLERLRASLAEPVPLLGFAWPSHDAAYLLGLIAARGEIDPSEQRVRVHFRFGPNAVRWNNRPGWIGKGEIGYLAPEHIGSILDAARERIVPTITDPSHITVTPSPKGASFVLVADYRSDPDTFQKLKDDFFAGAASYKRFHIPSQVHDAGREYQEEFLRGYAVACGLVSSGTRGPTGQEQVWLRPATENQGQFQQLLALIDGLGLRASKHQRKNRDVAIKVPCEDWLEIGFQIDWVDSIVEEGARLNRALE